ncbi:MAG: pentapeptide repeat-containing protein [Plectolyngbya sp. WJT66-NPBG17]|jgi:hypothetical protein|nr:pentapeptide repeat-containing protein [Plectolyngbya sp. WJT66-NPBG17]
MQPVTPSVTQNFFVIPGVNVHQGDPDYSLLVNLSEKQLKQRWDTPEGQNILARWKSSGFSRDALDSLVGKIYDRTDLRGVSLIGEKLNGVDLSKIDFYKASLKDSDLTNANLRNSYLSEANIEGANFSFAKADGLYLDNADFNSKTSFKGVNISDINFTFATLLQESIAAQSRIIDLERKRPLLASFLRISCDYGRSFTQFFFWCFVVIAVFTLLYAFIPGLVAKLEMPANMFIKASLFDSFYLSTMTFITIGTDVVPISMLGKVLMMLEGGIGYLMTGLLVAILVKRTVGE